MSITPIYVFAKWQVREPHLETVLRYLASVAHNSSNEKGNLFYRAHQSTADPHTILLYEAYENETALNDHLTADYFQTIVMEKIVPLLEKREVVLCTESDLNI